MKIISSVEKLKNRLFTVSEDHAVDPSGFEIKRFIVHHRGSAVMMPVDDRKRVLLVRQYRLPAERMLVGAARRFRRSWRKAAPNRQARAERGDRISRQELEKAHLIFPQPRLPHRKDDHLSRHRPHRRRCHADGRRAHRNPLVYGKEIEAAIDAGEILDAKTMLGLFFLETRTLKGLDR